MKSLKICGVSAVCALTMMSMSLQGAPSVKWNVDIQKHGAITFKRVEKSKFTREGHVFVSAFIDAYKNLTDDDLKLNQKYYNEATKGYDRKLWLHDAFVEQAELAKKDPEHTYIIHALKGKEVKGVACFTMKDDVVNVRCLAVSPHYQKAGIGKALVLSMLKFVPQGSVKCMVLSVYKKNENALAFCARLGFKLLDGDALTHVLTEQNLNPEITTALVRDITSQDYV